MHLKTITLQGFKSYRDQGAIGDGDESKEFSAQANLIVGKNGSGKSNFFSALQFVLGQGRFQKILPEQRRDLLHEGTGRAVLSAYVEVVFDNSDQRLIVHSEKQTGGLQYEKLVAIRRTVGLKKDEYRINDKAYSHIEVQNLLETAGLSAQNPYNVVQQGRIAAFAMMNDEGRFDVIKDVAGTKVYEDRRDSSMKQLEKTRRDMGTIDGNLKVMEEKIKALGQEREEFKAYQHIDRKRRSLQYCYYKQEAEEARKQVDRLRKANDERSKQTNAGYEEMDTMVEKKKELDESLEHVTMLLQEAKGKQARTMKERADASKRLAKASAHVTTVKEVVKDAEGQRKKLEGELKEVQGRVKEEEKKSTRLEDGAGKAQDALGAINDELRKAEGRVTALLAKRGRKEQFKSRAERDKYLNAELKKVEPAVAGLKDQIGKLRKDTKQSAESIGTLKKSKQEREKELTERYAAGKALRADAEKAAYARDQLADRRRAAFRRQGELQREKDEAQERYSTWEHRVMGSVPWEIRRGVDNVKDIVQKHGIGGVYGPVINLFQVSPELCTACDVIAANTLFHIVVETSDTVAQIMKVFNKEKREGRPSFYPLNRLNAVRKALPTHGNDCFPLYDKIKFHEHYEKVFADLFGKVLVCSTLEAASRYSRDCNCDCVTPEGDKVDRRGGIQGGWISHQFSRTEAQMNADKGMALVGKLQEKVQAVQDEGAAIDKQISEAREGAKAAEVAVEQGKRWIERAMNDQKAEEMKLREKQQFLTDVGKQTFTVQDRLKDAEATRARIEEELGTEMVEKLSAAETKELADLQQGTDKLRKEQAAQSAKSTTLASDLAKVVEALRGNLSKREFELRDRLGTLSRDSAPENVARAQADEAEAESRLAQLDKELKGLEQETDRHTAEKTKAEKQAEDIRVAAEKAKRVINENKLQMHEKEGGRKVFEQRREEAMEKIRKLGALPADTKEFDGHDAPTLLKELTKVNTEIKKYSHVNRKAAEMFGNINEQMISLKEQRDARLEDYKDLERLIENLDEKKDEAVLRTFRQIKDHFDDMFRQLVGHDGATGKLAMRRRSDLDGDREEELRKKKKGKKASGKKDDDDEKKAVEMEDVKVVDEFKSVTVAVNFGVGGAVGGGARGDQDMSRLSGGQKSLVALALIFAIQKVDPAPFYVFDEVDAALDAEYRTNVASMVEQMSKSAQFLIASFKSEMVGICQRHFAISFQNKVSKIGRCPPEAAQKLLRAAEAEADRERGGPLAITGGPSGQKRLRDGSSSAAGSAARSPGKSAGKRSESRGDAAAEDDGIDVEE